MQNKNNGDKHHDGRQIDFREVADFRLVVNPYNLIFDFLLGPSLPGSVEFDDSFKKGL